MAGFLDSKEQVIDMVLTDVGKSLLLKGDLRFKYWIPFDDEVDYNPQATPRTGQTQVERELELTETPLTREATMGYRGLNFREEDTTNVYRPMFTAPPGVGHSYPVPRMTVNTGSLSVSVKQKKLKRKYVSDDDNKTVVTDLGFQRVSQDEAVVEAKYVDRNIEYVSATLAQQPFPEGTNVEGFLVTVYHNSTLKLDELGQQVGGFEEVLNNRDMTGSITYRNDIKVNNYTP